MCHLLLSIISGDKPTDRAGCGGAVCVSDGTVQQVQIINITQLY